MSSRPYQEGRNTDRGWAFRAVLLVAAWGATASARPMTDDGDMPQPLTDSLREAGIVAEPAARPVTKPVAKPATLALLRPPCRYRRPRPPLCRCRSRSRSR